MGDLEGRKGRNLLADYVRPAAVAKLGASFTHAQLAQLLGWRLPHVQRLLDTTKPPPISEQRVVHACRVLGLDPREGLRRLYLSHPKYAPLLEVWFKEPEAARGRRPRFSSAHLPWIECLVQILESGYQPLIRPLQRILLDWAYLVSHPDALQQEDLEACLLGEARRGRRRKAGPG